MLISSSAQMTIHITMDCVLDHEIDIAAQGRQVNPVRIPFVQGVLDTTLCDKVYQSITAGRRFSLGTPVSSTNKTDRHDITAILLKVALNTITPNAICFV